MQLNPVNTDTAGVGWLGGGIEIVHINRVSVLGGLNLEKMSIFSFTNTVKHTKPLVIKTFQECFLCYDQSQQRSRQVL